MLIHQKLRELFGVSPEEAELFSALSLGKVGLALRLARDPSWMAARAGLLDLVVSVMSGPGLNALQAAESIRQAAARFPLQIESLSGDGAEAVAERLASRLQLQLVLEQTSLLLRDALLLRHSEQQDVRPLIANRDRLGEIERLARSRSPEQLQRAANVAFTAQDFLRRNANPQLLLENLLLELALPGA